MAKTIPISDQVVLISGSSRGLGLAIGHAFRSQGSHVILNYQNDLTPKTLHNIQSYSHFQGLKPNFLPPSKDSLLLQADMTNQEEVKAVFDLAANYYGRPISTVINNAMAGSFQFNGNTRTKLHDLTWQEMNLHQEGFLRAALNTTQAAIPGFEKLGLGRIINIGSNLFSNPVVPYHDYVAGKGSLLAFTRTSSMELGPKNVNVNMVSAGLLRTTDASAATPEEVFDQIAAMTPLRRVCRCRRLRMWLCFWREKAVEGLRGRKLLLMGGWS